MLESNSSAMAYTSTDKIEKIKINESVFKRAQRFDKLARLLIIGSGILVIISVIGILFLIAGVALPLFQAPHKETLAQFTPQSKSEAPWVAVVPGEYLETGAVLDQTGQWTFYDLKKQNVLVSQPSSYKEETGASILQVEAQEKSAFTILWNDGTTTLEQVKITPKFTINGRVMKQDVITLATVPPLSDQMPVQSIARVSFVEDEGGRRTYAQRFENNQIEVIQEVVTLDFMDNEETESFTATIQSDLPDPLSVMVVDGSGKHLYAGTTKGSLLHWSLEEPGEPELIDNIKAFSDNRSITALSMVFGDVSLAVGDSTGQVSTWFPVPASENSNHRPLTLVHKLSKHEGAVSGLFASPLDKSLMSKSEHGVVYLDHMTSERHLLEFGTEQPLSQFSMGQRGNGLIGFDNNQQLTMWKIENPHPEISWTTLFGEVLYESYPEEDYVWQSSSASDDFEPKFSLVPLIFGSLKGTFYAMLLAVPLAFLGAIYTSQFASDEFRRIVKPAVEIMAAMPSVIIGFLAALWLAPIVENYIVTFFLSLFFIPLTSLAFIGGWASIRHTEFVKRMGHGYEFLMMIPVVFIGCVLAVYFQSPVEALFFGGDFKTWLFEDMGMRYDQRNNVIIAFGLGFMVIPIIFTMADDALTNVPESLKAASLALGASRWQTVWRIVIPSASPGMFAAFIIGFGRAVGETMVVLMATGNTPILDWSIFNGMRTLAANIAVELPEAPVDGSLYRLLFLSAVILFLITSILNTAAELIRQRLRKKYGQF